MCFIKLKKKCQNIYVHLYIVRNNKIKNCCKRNLATICHLILMINNAALKICAINKILKLQNMYCNDN